MRVTTYQGEQSLAELARRLYVLGGPQAEQQLAAVEKELLRANPVLAGLPDIEPGTKLLVPEVAGVAFADDAGAGLGGPELQQLQDDLTQTFVRLDSAAEAAELEARESLKVLKGKELKRLANEVEGLRSELDRTEKAVQARVKEIRAGRIATKDAIARLGADLLELRRLMSG